MGWNVLPHYSRCLWFSGQHEDSRSMWVDGRRLAGLPLLLLLLFYYQQSVTEQGILQSAVSVCQGCSPKKRSVGRLKQDLNRQRLFETI